MSVAFAKTITLQGVRGEVVTVEIDVGDGLPGFSILGLPDTSILESRERVRSALINSGEEWLNRKVTVSLTPAWLPKSGPHFDLAIAISLLDAMGALPNRDHQDEFFLGELGLDGAIRSVRGVLPSLLTAEEKGLQRAFISSENEKEAQAVTGIDTLAFTNLKELLNFLRTGELPDRNIDFDSETEIGTNQEVNNLLDLSDIAGQDHARKAMEIAAVGGHHCLLLGPPGTGKTMFAERMTTILPPLSASEALEVAAIHSIAGRFSAQKLLAKTPPYIAPHHSITMPALIGGGRIVQPGAVSIAHKGVLFIDEAPEATKTLLDSLREPLESKFVTISRFYGTLTYPADFLLVLAANPCPCGRYSGRGLNCQCTQGQIRKYFGKLSAPLLDRIDIRIFVDRPTRLEMAQEQRGESSAVVRARVVAAREKSKARLAQYGLSKNSQLTVRLLRKEFAADKSAMALLYDEMESERITARGFHKILRLAWSITDLAGNDRPNREQVMEAIALREGLDRFA
jgi:magnesium chelatase family protein